MSQQNDLGTLLHHLVSLMSRESDQTLQEQLGIGISQYKILTTLHEHPHVQQRIIATTLGQTEASISRQIKILTEKGMLVALKNPNNRREHLADLTPRGLRMIEAAEHVLQNYHDKFFSGLADKQQSQLLEQLFSLHRNVCYMQHPGLHEDIH
jgi:MarR family transcriptional regulator for hemolysin